MLRTGGAYENCIRVFMQEVSKKKRTQMNMITPVIIVRIGLFAQNAGKLFV